MTDIHSCGYFCDRPLCIKAQRDELRNKMFSDQAVKTYSGGKPNYTQPIEQEPFEYWNAVEGWVKIDEVRQHFDTANCGTIYKHEGEGRIPLYAAPPQREWIGLTDEEARELCVANVPYVIDMVRALEAKLKEKNGG